MKVDKEIYNRVATEFQDKFGFIPSEDQIAAVVKHQFSLLYSSVENSTSYRLDGIGKFVPIEKSSKQKN